MKLTSKDYIKRSFKEHLIVIKTLDDEDIIININKAALLISQSIKKGGTVYWCGNGGSAADSQHLAAELVGRFIKDRPPIPSRSLSTDTSILTCISNDYSYDNIFSRQISAMATCKDILIGISTSGNSRNVENAIKEANRKDCETIALVGKNGGDLIKSAKNIIHVKSNITARIQEAHILIGHIIIGLIEKELNYD